MDRRNWLWRRKSSEKSPGETESSGGSMSSHSERFSDDQIYSNQSFQSPDVTSKAELQQEELEGGVKTLSQKLSEALINIGIKEDLVKQHSKVAEEAVEGWEKAENEVLALRQQVEVLTLRNSALEDRVCHLDGALKECLRQLRQTRDENEGKTEEAFQKKTYEWQMTKAELEKQISDLRSQLQSVKKSETEKQISVLKLELASMAEELELRFIERELSNQAAEQASKLHLESVKKAAKFEAECHRLNAALVKALAASNARKDSLPIVESDDFMETYEFESNQTTPATEINLLDDFLEMERLVALPEGDSKRSLQNRISEVEIALGERENELETSRNELKVANSRLVKLEALLVNANDARETTEKELESVKAIVKVLQERVKRYELEAVEVNSRLAGVYAKKMEAESRLATLEAELIPKVASLETEVGKERALSGKLGAKCRELELKVDYLETEKEEALSKMGSLISEVDSLEAEVEKERALSNKMGVKSRELEVKVDYLETEKEEARGKMGSLVTKVDSLEAEVEKERASSNKMRDKLRELEAEISRLQQQNQCRKPSIQNLEISIKQDTELALAGTKFADCQKTIASLNRQLKTLATLEDLLI